MDIAIGGLVLLTLLLPGISFNKGFYSGKFSRSYLTSDFFGLFIGTVFPSLILYLLASGLIYFLGYTYDLTTLLGIISSNEALVERSIIQINQYFAEITWFQFLINLSSFVLGRLTRICILRFSLDTKYEILRFENIWHYLISARFLDTNDILTKDSPEDVDLTFVDALVNYNGVSYIYTGVLVDYQLGKDGTLDLIVITKAQRKEISRRNSISYKDIPGNYLVLKYSDLLNLNFTFIQLDVTLDENENIVAVEPRIIK
jgi:hypothetical protein